MNPGVWHELTDGRGEFWQYRAADTVFVAGPASERARALEQAACAHTRVTWKTKSLGGGLTTGWWDCDLCGTKFSPVAVDPPPSGASSVDAPIYRQVYIVTHYPEGGLRGVHASQAGAEAEIAELCREYPDYTRQDFSIVCDRIRPSPPSGASPQATGGYIHHSLTDWIPTPECDCDRCTSARKSAPKPTGGASPQAETSEDEDDAPAVDSWSAPLRKPVVPKILSTDDFYALLRIIEVLPVADPFLTDLQSKLSAEERRQHGNRASHLSGPEFVREIERIEALIQSRLPAPVSPVEPESSSFEANTASNLLQKVELSTLDRYRNTNQMDVDTWMVRAVASSEPRSEDDLVLLDHVIALLKPTVEPEPPDMRLADVREACAALGLVPGATISSVQRALHVNAPTAMRLLSIREAIASVPTAEPEPCVWRADWREGRDGSILVPSCQPEMEIDAAFVQECVQLHGWKFCVHCGAPLKVEREP